MTTLGQARNAYPAMRIFFFGQEVSEDALKVICNWADDTRAPSTATVTLSNKPTGTGGPVSRYIMEKEDILSIYTDINPTTIALPDVKQLLANDPVLEQLRATALERQTFLKDFVGPTLGPDSVLQQAQDEYISRLGSIEDQVNTRIRERIGASVLDPIKRRVLLTKFDKTQQVSQPDIFETGDKPTSDPRRATYLKGAAFRYPLWANRPIFHSNDPVRIFLRDPFNPRAWFHMFAGFISDWTITKTADNEKTVTFVCEDVLRLLRYARTTTNPGLFDIAKLKQQEDFVTRTFFNEDFTKITLTELLYTFLFGPEIPGTTEILADQGNLDQSAVKRIKGADDLQYVRYSANGQQSIQRIPAFGIGAFNFDRSITFNFGPPSTQQPVNVAVPNAGGGVTLKPVQSLRLLQREVNLNGADALGVYQAYIDHQVQVSDLETMVFGFGAPSRSSLPIDPSTGEPTIESIITELGENPHRYPVDGGRLIVLAPSSLGANVTRDLLSREFKGVEAQTTFKSRLFVILNLLERVEFRFFATPKGDVVAEMPLYDFDPADWGEDEISYNAVSAATATTPATSTARALILDMAARGAVGPFAPHYRVALKDTLDNSQTFTDEKVKTQFMTSWWVIRGVPGAGPSLPTLGQVEVATLRALVPAFGVRDEQQEPPIYISSPEAAQVYAQLKLNQINAEALTSSVDLIPMMRMGPNRPIEVDDGPYIATLRSRAMTLDWAGRDMSTNIGVNYTRVWDGLVDAGNKPIYTPIGGAASRPMNYAALFRVRAPVTSTKFTGGTPAALAPPAVGGGGG